MYDGLEHVGRAAEKLASEEGSLRDRLRSATAELAVAMIQQEEWPKDIWPQAVALRDKLVAINKARGVIDQRAAKRAAEELIQLFGYIKFHRGAEGHDIEPPDPEANGHDELVS